MAFLDALKEIPRRKFALSLGWSLRAAAVNFTQNYVTGIPFLAREVGAKNLKAEKLYHKAMFDAALEKNINPPEKRMLDKMIKLLGT